MTPAEYRACDAVELARLVRGKDVSPRELLEAAVQCIEAANPNLNAVIDKLYDRARAAIDVGLPDGPLRGVPFLLKDLGTHWRGTVSSYGSAAFRDFRADHDCEVVKRYTAAGLTIMGKTNTSEFGLSTSTEPHFFGPTRNPWSGGHSAGGSSGGAAAAVASCVVPIAEGTDAGGSIRIPASSCGVFGMKPTRARTPYGPQPSEGWAGATVIHAIARSVRDSAALLDCTRGPAAGDPYGVPEPERPYSDEIKLEPGRLRIALATSCWTGQIVHPDCSAAAADAARLCESLGHVVEPASPALDGDALARAMHVVISSNIRATLANRSKALEREITPDEVERITWKVSEAGRRFNAVDYIDAVHSFQHAGRTMGQFFRDYDVLLTPTQCVPPPRLGVLSLMNPDTHQFNKALWESLAFTFVYNVSGCPAMSVPLHRNAEGLPVGVQFGAAWAREATLYRLAAQLETTDRWTPKTASPMPPGS